MEIRNFTLSIVLRNRSGMLMRVAGLFSRRGYNIDTLQVAPMAENNQFSRIIMTSSGDDDTREQIVKQLEKLIDVREAKLI